MAGTSGNEPSTSHDPIITMSDYLNMMRVREKEARDILGGSDDTNCSYPSGYVKRQVVYSCLTCTPSPTDPPAGVCLACANVCHRDHQLIELYTKRNFKCDCGNSKFENRCRLCPDKDDVNELNKYNQNFRGEYCSCHRPYPDPAESFTRAMLQCSLCEDWYHENHLGRPNLERNDENDMICPYCVDKYPFLRAYELKDTSGISEDGTFESSESTASHNSWESMNMLEVEDFHGGNDLVDYDDVDEADSIPEVGGDGFLFNVLHQGEDHGGESEDDEGIAQVDEGLAGADGSNSDATSNDGENLGEDGEDLGLADNESFSDGSEEESVNMCTLDNQIIQAATKGRGIFMTQHWRADLCRCNQCIERYKSHSLEYLLDVEDTCEAYLMKSGEQEMVSVDDAMRLLSDGGRVQQLDIIEEFNNMRTRLMEYLQRFKETGETVTEADMRDFFNGLLAKKRRRLE